MPEPGRIYRLLARLQVSANREADRLLAVRRGGWSRNMRCKENQRQQAYPDQGFLN